MSVFTRNIGEVFDCRYKIIRTIGVGGMAIVYEALDLATGNHVAIKTLKETISEDPQALRRFINESKAVAMLSHKNIVKILDISVKTEHKFIVMEYIEGITLREYMNRKGPLGWREVLAFAVQILLALNHAHLKGVIHRDIKPQNIMVMDGGVIKVADFGIAKIPDADTITMMDHAIGTVYYISPEQAQGHEIDSRSDLYSLGVMLYEMVTGKLPFYAENPCCIMQMHIKDAPIPPTKHTPKLPIGVEQIILMMMEKLPKNRYQSASQVLRHIYSIQKDPTKIFHPERPMKSTPTGTIAIGRTSDRGTKQENQEPEKPSDTTRKPYFEPKNFDKGRTSRFPEYVPFSVVVVICIAFLVLAIIGFVVLFYLLSDAKQTVSLQSISLFEENLGAFSPQMWKTLLKTEHLP